MNSLFTLGAAGPILLLASSLSAAQTSMTGAEAVREIDWSALGPGSPIPRQMPVAESDDPVEAGFARQWLYRVVTPQPPNTDAWKDVALEIATKHRNPGDQWASRMEKELRRIIYEKIPQGSSTRVFCNTLGCLCYVERAEGTPLLIVYSELVGTRGRELGVRPTDVEGMFGHLQPQWELTVVKRPAHNRSDGVSHNDVPP